MMVSLGTVILAECAVRPRRGATVFGSVIGNLHREVDESLGHVATLEMGVFVWSLRS
jgi:hypothetical protein